MRTGFRGKPSRSHIIWTHGGPRDGTGKTRFDTRGFERWADHLGLDFETTTRVDHDRGDEPREQYRCVYAWGETGGETLEMEGEQWDLGSQRAPRTFIEIDETTKARIKGWGFETVLDVVEMRYDGPDLFITSAGGDKKRLEGRALATHPSDRE